MAELSGTFDPGAIADDRALVPAHEAVAQIFESDLIYKDSSGALTQIANQAVSTYAKFGWEIIGGPHAGRKLWTGENIQHPNAQAQEIGQRTLKRICEAAGLGPIRNTDELHFKPILITIIEKPPETKNGKTYDAKNEIKGYKFYGPPKTAPGAPQGSVTAPATTQAAAPATTAGAVPWPTRTA